MSHQLQRLISSSWLVGLCALLMWHPALGQTSSTARLAPAWLRDGVVYELFPRSFSHEGNFNGITPRLDDLKDLGVTVLWLMPIHPIGVEQRKGTYGSPYAARDYYAVNPDYGTKADLRRLVGEAHRRGMKVILDMVLLHTAWDSVMMEHPDFYKHNAQGKIVPPVPEWNDVAGLNYDNPALRRYLVDMLKYWLTNADVDGYRCDTASMIPTSFWEEARTEFTKTKPDIIMLAESDKPELLLTAFDIDYAWSSLNTIRDVLGNSAPASAIEHTWLNDRQRYPQGALRLMMSDNHDQPRAVACFGIKGALAASALMFCLDGVPLLYNGMEVGDATESGDPALFEKVPVFWHPKGRPAVTEIYRSLIQLRNQYPAFRTGTVRWVHNSNDAELVTFLRADDKDELLVAINFSSRPVRGRLELKSGEAFDPVKLAGVHYSNQGQLPELQLKGFEWRIYHRRATLAAAQ
ncbi:MAG TPA: alpha-amylase family glycosyl hydrolase [Verrucomicrobiae bacterium]|nr:alpha-amylase family glycosyl hydrolase [Verrucomicrobiae bacterium]